jgi:hypothetical protein
MSAMNKDNARRIAQTIALHIDEPESYNNETVFRVLSMFAKDHPAVQRAQWAIDAARKAANAAVTSELEGLVGARLQELDAERVVGWLVRLLDLVPVIHAAPGTTANDGLSINGYLRLTADYEAFYEEAAQRSLQAFVDCAVAEAKAVIGADGWAGQGASAYRAGYTLSARAAVRAADRIAQSDKERTARRTE